MLRTILGLEVCSCDLGSMAKSLLLQEMSILYQMGFVSPELGGFGGSWGENLMLINERNLFSLERSNSPLNSGPPVEYRGCKEEWKLITAHFLAFVQHLLKMIILYWDFVCISSFICKEGTSNLLIRELVFRNQNPTVLDASSLTEKFQLSSSICWTGIGYACIIQCCSSRI